MKKVMIVAAFAGVLGMATPVFADPIQELHDRVDETWDKVSSVQDEARDMNKDTNNRVDAIQNTLYDEGVIRAEGDRIVASNAKKYTDKQVSALGNAVQHNSDRIDANSARLDVMEDWKGQVDQRFDKLDKKMSSGIAGVAAMANIPSPAVAGTTTVGAGLGHFNSQTSVAVGASSYFHNGVSVKGSLAAGSEVVVGAGVGYTW